MEWTGQAASPPKAESASGTGAAPASIATLPPAPQGPPRPARLLIPSLGLDAPIEGVGLDPDGAMGTPQNLWNVGWFNRGPAPGAAGDAVIDGHLGLPGAPLVFSNLSRLRVGAPITVLSSDGARANFIVRSVASWPAASHPPGLFDIQGGARLSLITCTGNYRPGSQTYADRLIVDAALV